MKPIILIFGSILLLGMGVLASSSAQTTPTESDDLYFVYHYTIGDRHQIRWFPVDNPLDETHLNTPPFYEYAISPTGEYIAIVGVGENPQVHIVNLRTQSISSLPLYQPRLELLWDEHHLRSGTLLWSPDGTLLAFTGMTTPDSPKSDIFLFDTQTTILTNVTRSMAVTRAIIPNSWSPDGNWLTITGAWSWEENNQGSIVPVWVTRAFSMTNNQVFDVAPGHRTCRLAWSPDGGHLASDTGCLVGPGEFTSLMVFPFDIESINEDGLRLIDINQPIYLEWTNSGGWGYYYSEPIWIDNTTLVANRVIYPMQFYNPFFEETVRQESSRGLIGYNEATYSEFLIREAGSQSEQPDRHHDWFILGNTEAGIGKDTLYQPITGQIIDVPGIIHSCPPTYAVELSADGHYMAVHDACGIERRYDTALRLFDTIIFQEIISFNAIAGVAQFQVMGYFTLRG